MFHRYGKSPAKNKRKMGHINVVAEDGPSVQALLAALEQVIITIGATMCTHEKFA